MSNLIKILWLEEETKTTLTDRRAYLESSLDYDIYIKETYEESAAAIRLWDDYQIIIIDIRLPLGEYNYSNEEKVNKLLAYGKRRGLKLVEELAFFGEKALKRVMLYTNESWEDVKDSIERLGLNKNLSINKSQFLQKKNCNSNQMFESLILEIIKRNS